MPYRVRVILPPACRRQGCVPYTYFMGFFYLYYALGLPTFLSIIIALYLLFTGANSSLEGTKFVDFRFVLFFGCAGSGEAFNVGQFLEETSPYLWASTGIGFCIGFSVLGAGWYVRHTHNRRPRDLVCFHSSPSSVSSQGYFRHWFIHPRRWCQSPPHTD